MKRNLSISILIISIVYLFCGCKSSNYENAAALLSEGNYEAARIIYQQLEENGGYKDSSEKILECSYMEAEVALDNKNYSRAYDLFLDLGDYKDAYVRSQESGYIFANQLAANENYSEAARIFSSLNDYEKSDELYLECTLRMMTNTTVGDLVLFGKYEIDGNIENGPEPIPWIVLGKNDDNLFLLSEYIIEKMRYSSKASGHYWSSCDIREWLNGDFYNQTFSPEEKKIIQKMITSDKTDDNVFLLSAEETRGFFKSDDSRIAYRTDYMKKQNFYGRHWVKNGETDWWTRSVSTASNGKGVVTVGVSGGVSSTGSSPDIPNKYSSHDIGIRPAICINISKNLSQDAQNISMFGYDSNRGLDNEPNKWSSKSSKNYDNSSGKCIMCNGTGWVKYYYGSSDLEAWLSGHDPYTVGPCTSCDGTGK